jgi:hypothetical protein
MEVNDESNGTELDALVDDNANDQELKTDAQDPEKVETSPAPELPEKYRGKSVADIVRMHAEAEKALGRQGAELGELRRVADEFIKRQLDSKEQPSAKRDESPEVDFFREPEKAVEQLISNNPKVKAMEEQAEMMRRQSNLAKMETTHPDYMEVLGDQGFQEWVGKSKIRTALFARADANYDFDAADELLSTYKEIKGRATPTEDVTDTEKSTHATDTLSKGKAVPSGRLTPSDTNIETKGKYLSRRKLIDMLKNDPAEYYANGEAIRKAYAEGRVR